jgi:hypothetical protein
MLRSAPISPPLRIVLSPPVTFKRFTFVYVSTKSGWKSRALPVSETVNLFLVVYKTVSYQTDQSVEKLSLKKQVQNWLKSSLDDPIGKILAENSNLTKTQIETLLIDVLSENVAQKSLKYEEKGRLRPTKAGVSRGAFSRTLRQARTNVIQAIYTILLLGYLGVFESTRLDSYLEISNKLQTYINAYRETLGTQHVANEHLRVINMLHEELKMSLERLTEPKSMSDRV